MSSQWIRLRRSLRQSRSVPGAVPLLLAALGSLLLRPARTQAEAAGGLEGAPRPAAVELPRFAALGPVEVAGKTYHPYSFDGHVHTLHSPDAFNEPHEVLEAAERAGLHAVIITDHGSARAKLEFPKFQGRLTPHVGQEIGGPFGHAVFWNVFDKQEVVPSRTSLAERAAFAHARGGLIVLCHPGWWISGRAEDPMHWITPEALGPGGQSAEIDALELWNGMYDLRLRGLIGTWEEALAAGVYVPIVGNSDFHRMVSHRLGGPRNVAYCTTPDPKECLWSAVKQGRLYITDGPALLLTVNDAMLGERTEVAAGGSLKVHVRLDAPRGGELRIYLGKELVRSTLLPPGQPLDESFALPAPASDSYLRAEVVRAPRSDKDPGVDLLTNPVFVSLRR